VIVHDVAMSGVLPIAVVPVSGRDRRDGPERKADSTLDKKSHLVAVLVQAGALLINHIAPGNRTLAPSA
jgi:hypothetical protein